MKVAQQSETKAIGIAGIMNAAPQAGHGICTAFKDVSQFIHQEVITDIAPTLRIHVIVLNATDLAFGRFERSGVPVARRSSVMDNRPGQRATQSQTAIRSAGHPTGAGTNIRLRSGSRLSFDLRNAEKSKGTGKEKNVISCVHDVLNSDCCFRRVVWDSLITKNPAQTPRKPYKPEHLRGYSHALLRDVNQFDRIRHHHGTRHWDAVSDADVS